MNFWSNGKILRKIGTQKILQRRHQKANELLINRGSNWELGLMGKDKTKRCKERGSCGESRSSACWKYIEHRIRDIINATLNSFSMSPCIRNSRTNFQGVLHPHIRWTVELAAELKTKHWLLYIYIRICLSLYIFTYCNMNSWVNIFLFGLEKMFSW